MGIVGIRLRSPRDAWLMSAPELVYWYKWIKDADKAERDALKKRK
jgi:hypothetical protein